MKRVLLNAAAILVILAAMVYAGDYVAARFHIPRSRQLYSTITVRPYYAVPLKDNKIEFDFLDPQPEVCIHSLFPHFGHRPCWYVDRNKNKQINM